MEAKALGADVAKFQRGESVPTKRIADQKTRGEMGRSEWMAQEAAVRAAKSEILQPHEAGFLEAEGMEKTFKFTQDLIRENVDKASARKIFELKLEYGQYKLRYSRNGRHLLMGGQKGREEDVKETWRRHPTSCPRSRRGARRVAA